MNHEPECAHFEADDPERWDPCTCDRLMAAYRRGRRDAADALLKVEEVAVKSRAYIPRGTAIAAAEGDDDQ